MNVTRPVAAVCGLALAAGLTACSGDADSSDESLGTGPVSAAGALGSSSTRPSSTPPSSASASSSSSGGSFADRAGIPPRRYTDAAAEIDIPDQRGDGRSVRVGEVRLTRGPGHIAIFTGDGTLLGSARVNPSSSPVTIRLDRPVTRNGELVGVLFTDDGDGRFDVAKDRAVNDGDTDPDDRLDLQDEDFDYALR